MLEAHVQIEEEITELRLERFEKWLCYLILNLSWEFLIKIEFFNDEVIIIYESILNEFFDGVIELVGNVLVSVTILKS